MNVDQYPTDRRQSLAVAIRRQGTTTVIELDGKWDSVCMTAAQQAFATALDARPECMVIDLSRLTLIDTSAVTATVELAGRSRNQGTRLVIIPGSQSVQDAFELAGVVDELPFIEPLGREITGPQDGLLESTPWPGAPGTLQRGSTLARPRPDHERPSNSTGRFDRLDTINAERAVLRELRLFSQARKPQRPPAPFSSERGNGPRAA